MSSRSLDICSCTCRSESVLHLSWREGRGAFSKQCCHCVPVESPLIFLFWNYTSRNHYKSVFHLCTPCCNGKRNIFHWASLSSRALAAAIDYEHMTPPVPPPLKESWAVSIFLQYVKLYRWACVYFTIECVMEVLARFIPSCQSNIKEMLSRYRALVLAQWLFLS